MSRSEVLSWSSRDSKRLVLSVQVERHVGSCPPIELGELRGREARPFEDMGCVEREDDVRRRREFGDLAEGGKIEAAKERKRGRNGV